MVRSRNGDADAGGDQPVRLGGRAFADDDVDDLSRFQQRDPLLDRNFLAMRREDARHAHQVVASDFGVAQGQLEAGEFLAVNSDPLGEADFLRYVHLVSFRTDR